MGKKLIFSPIKEKLFLETMRHIGLLIFRFGLVAFYGISTIIGYLMPNPFYTYILNIYDLVWLGFMAYSPMLVI